MALLQITFVSAATVLLAVTDEEQVVVALGFQTLVDKAVETLMLLGHYCLHMILGAVAAVMVAYSHLHVYTVLNC